MIEKLKPVFMKRKVNLFGDLEQITISLKKSIGLVTLILILFLPDY